MRQLTAQQKEELKNQIIAGANYQPQYLEVTATKESSEATQKRFLALSDEQQSEFKTISADAYVADSTNGGKILIIKKNQLTETIFNGYITNQF